MLDIGLANTPYETNDRFGRSMGFNDPFFSEHYQIMVANFTLQRFLHQDNAYTWLLLAAHIGGVTVVFMVSRGKTAWYRWHFALQWLAFPLGLLGMVFVPWSVLSIANGWLDREGVIDVPLAVSLSHPVWCISATIAFFLVRAGLLNAICNRRREIHGSHCS